MSQIEQGYAAGADQYSTANAPTPDWWPQATRTTGRCSPYEQMHRWACKHEKTCECGEVTRVAVPEGL